MNTDYSFDPPHQNYRKHRFAINVRIMISALIVLVFVVFFVILLHLYARWIWRHPARLSRRTPTSRRRRFHFTGEEPPRLWNVGLDSAMLAALPVFPFKPQNFTDALDCAVCLCEFEENEKCRVLPNCRHSFHVECIDMWFRSHSTCPVCRAWVQPGQPVLESIRIEQVWGTIPGPIPSGIHENLNSEQGQTAVSGEEYIVQNPTNIFSWDRQKQMNAENDQGTSGGRRALIIPQISVEIPKRPDGISWSSESHYLCSPNGSQASSKSPAARLRSLTRMLSRDTERKVFPSEHPAEFDLQNHGQ